MSTAAEPGQGDDDDEDDYRTDDYAGYGAGGDLGGVGELEGGRRRGGRKRGG